MTCETKLLLQVHFIYCKQSSVLIYSFLTELAIHVSPSTKKVLDEFGSFVFEERKDEVFLKVRLITEKMNCNAFNFSKKYLS